MHAGMFSRSLKCLHDRVRIRCRARKKHLDNGAWRLTAHFQQTQLKRFERAGNTSENARLRYMNGMLLNAMSVMTTSRICCLSEIAPKSSINGEPQYHAVPFDPAACGR